jgi:hypothetical protein
LPLPLRIDRAGPVVDYLNELETKDPELFAMSRETRAAVRRVLSTPDGAILLDLLEKATVLFSLHPSADPRACDALTAQRLIAVDLRRIASNDPDVEPQAGAQPRGRNRSR